MALEFKAPENVILKPIITVLGVGGAGGNAVNNMIRAKAEQVYQLSLRKQKAERFFKKSENNWKDKYLAEYERIFQAYQ